MNRKVNPFAAVLVVLIVVGIVAFVMIRSSEAPLGGAPHGITEAMSASSSAAHGPQKPPAEAGHKSVVAPATTMQATSASRSTTESRSKSAGNPTTAARPTGATANH